MLRGGGSAEPTALFLLSLSPRLLLPLLSDVKKKNIYMYQKPNFISYKTVDMLQPEVCSVLAAWFHFW